MLKTKKMTAKPIATSMIAPSSIWSAPSTTVWAERYSCSIHAAGDPPGGAPAEPWKRRCSASPRLITGSPEPDRRLAQRGRRPDVVGRVGQERSVDTESQLGTQPRVVDITDAQQPGGRRPSLR